MDLINPRRFHQELQRAVTRSEKAALLQQKDWPALEAEARRWASRTNQRARLVDAEAQLVEGWEQLLQICVTEAPASLPRLQSSQGVVRKSLADLGLGAQGLAGLMTATLDQMVQHRDAEMVCVQPLARSVVVLAAELRKLHMLFGAQSDNPKNPVGMQAETLAPRDVEALVGTLLEALRQGRGGGAGQSSAEYRGTLASALTHLLRYLTQPPSIDRLYLHLEQTMNRRSLGAMNAGRLGLAGAGAGGLGELEESALQLRADLRARCLAFQRAFMPLLHDHCDALVASLARDATDDAVAPIWRATSLSTLTALFQCLATAGDSDLHQSLNDTRALAAATDENVSAQGDFVTTKALYLLKQERYLERVSRIATAPLSPGPVLLGGDSQALALIQNGAMALLTQIGTHQRGAEELFHLKVFEILLGAQRKAQGTAADPAVSALGAAPLVLGAAAGPGAAPVGGTSVGETLAQALYPSCRFLLVMSLSIDDPRHQMLAEHVLVRPLFPALFVRRGASISLPPVPSVVTCLDVLHVTLTERWCRGCRTGHGSCGLRFTDFWSQITRSFPSRHCRPLQPSCPCSPPPSGSTPASTVARVPHFLPSLRLPRAASRRKQMRRLPRTSVCSAASLNPLPPRS